jgi:uncharacterized protein (TIGR03083 family)
METDPRRWISALRASHDRLVELVGELDDDALERQSMASEWTVAQVLSHLGSSAEISEATLETAAGAPDPLGDGGREAVWSRWDAMSPREQAMAFVHADRQLVERYEGLDDDELANLRVTLVFLPEPITVAQLASFRLGEHAFHSWDVAGAFDRNAEIAPDSTELLIDLQRGIVGLASQFIPRENRPAEERTLLIETTAPARTYELVLGEGAELRSGELDGDSDGELAIPAEALLRLFAGRLQPGSPSADVEPSAGMTMEELRRAFPGY